MKKNNYLLLLMAFALVSCTTSVFKDYEENLLHLNNIKGQVKSIRTETFEAEEKFGEIQKGESEKSYFSLLLLSLYDVSILFENSFYEFTKHGKLKTMEFIDEDYSRKTTFVYDDSGNIMEEVYRFDEEFKQTTKYNYEKGKLVSSVADNKNGKELRAHYMFEGELIKEVVDKNEEGGILSKIEYSYKDGVQTESVYLAEKLMNECKRDFSGRILETFTTFKNERTMIFYEGDNVFPSEMKTYRDDEICHKLELTLDDKSNIIEIREIDEDGDVETKYEFTYKFDKKGNWIELSTYEDGDLESITTRTIEYY